MSSATEAALQALIEAVRTSMVAAQLPEPQRNQTLPSRFKDYGKFGAFLNVLDGEGKPEDTSLGNSDEGAKSYNIFHRAQVEWVVQSANDASREATFDAGLVAINAALAADRSLGGAVDWCEIDETVRSNLVTEVLPNTKAILVYVRLEFLSSMPF